MSNATVRIEILPVRHTGLDVDWFTIRVSSSEGYAHEFGFEATEEALLRKWSYEAATMAVKWCKSTSTDSSKDALGHVPKSAIRKAALIHGAIYGSNRGEKESS